MQILKVGAVMLAGLGSTWAARTATDLLLTPQPATLVQAAAEPQPAAGSGSAAGEMPQLSREEVDEELRRAQAELAGKQASGELQEFRPSKPLPADLAIALPSDI
jgi:hypothetical protein